MKQEVKETAIKLLRNKHKKFLYQLRYENTNDIIFPDHYDNEHKEFIANKIKYLINKAYWNKYAQSYKTVIEPRQQQEDGDRLIAEELQNQDPNDIFDHNIFDYEANNDFNYEENNDFNFDDAEPEAKYNTEIKYFTSRKITLNNPVLHLRNHINKVQNSKKLFNSHCDKFMLKRITLDDPVKKYKMFMINI